MAIENMKTLNVRIKNKYDSYENWAASGLVLEAGEIAIAYTTVNVDVGNGKIETHPELLMKVGNGSDTFADLPFLSAKAADVAAWAKAANKPTYEASEITGIETFIAEYVEDTMGISVDTNDVFRIVKVDDYNYKLQTKGKTDADTAWADVADSVIVIPNDTAAIEALQGLVGDTKVADQIANAISDLDLANTYAAKSHTHTKSEITDFAHTHEIDDVNGLGDAIADAKKAGDDAAAALETYKTANDAEVAKKLNASEETGFVYSDGTTTPVVRTDVITKDEEVEVGKELTYLGSPEKVESEATAAILFTVDANIKRYGITLKKNENYDESEELRLTSDGPALYLLYDGNWDSLYYDDDRLDTNAITKLTTEGTITTDDLKAIAQIDVNKEIEKIEIRYSNEGNCYNISFYTGESTTISTTYSDLVLKVYSDEEATAEAIADLTSKINTNATNIAANMEANTEAIETLNTSLEEFKTDTNSALANKASTSSVSNLSSTVNNKLNKVSTEGFLYSDGTVTPSTRTDVITEQYTVMLKGTGKEIYYDSYDNSMSDMSFPAGNQIYILNTSNSDVVFEILRYQRASWATDYEIQNNIYDMTIPAGEGYLWELNQEDMNHSEGWEIRVAEGSSPDQVKLYAEETEFVDINYIDLAKQVSTNESNIATLTETVADHEKRVTKVETFFETAEGETLDTALDTLVEIQKYITEDGSAADEMVKDIADHEERIKAIEDAPYATTANVATAKGEAIADAEGKVNALKTGVEDGTVVAAKATEAAGYTADGAIDTAIKAASKAGTDAAAAVETGVEDGTIVAAKATVADTANDLSAALDEEIAGLIADAKSGAESAAAADAKSKADAAEKNAKDYADGLAKNYDEAGAAADALAEAKAYTDASEETLVVDSVDSDYYGQVAKIGLANQADYDESGNYNNYHTNIALISDEGEISIEAISGQTLGLDGEKQNGTLNFGINSVAASKVTGLAGIATTGNVDDLVQTENTYIVFDCGSSSVNI